jgi:hypothetical protein
MPLFETSEDRKRQRIVADAFSKKLGVEVYMTDTTEVYDLYALNPEDKNKYWFIGEVKCRDVLPNQYPDIFLSKDKREDVEAQAIILNTTPLFIIRYRNGHIRFLELGADKDFGTPRSQGRRDRGAAKDIEMIYNVHNSLLEDLVI